MIHIDIETDEYDTIVSSDALEGALTKILYCTDEVIADHEIIEMVKRILKDFNYGDL